MTLRELRKLEICLVNLKYVEFSVCVYVCISIFVCVIKYYIQAYFIRLQFCAYARV